MTIEAQKVSLFLNIFSVGDDPDIAGRCWESIKCPVYGF